MKLANNTICKVFSFVTFLLMFLVSCTKHSGSDNVTVPGLNVTSMYFSDPASHELTIDSFSYDVYGRLARYQRWGYDSTFSPRLLDSFDVVFNFSSSSTAPSAYTLYSMSSGTNNPVESHGLYYDGQNRIIKDSMLNAPSNGSAINNSVVINYRYDNNIIVCELFGYTTSGLAKFVTDSIFTSAAGNFTNNNWHFSIDGAIANNYQSNIFSNYANPFYNKTVAASIGPMLYQDFSYDFISPNVLSAQTYRDSQNFLTYSSMWTTDLKGRVIKGSEATPSGYAFLLTFHYSN